MLFIALYYYHSNEIKKQHTPEHLKNNRYAVWQRVDELRHEGHQKAKIAYVFWILANVILACIAAWTFYLIGQN